ncbi:EAL domain-containing protein [Oxalobacteraceae bacterium CAVE-383]|nr:EAL domain-containing protein [Oxalobacteraceae bacterium CAVE-383]
MKFRRSMFRSVYARMFLVICAAAVPTFIGLCFYVYQQRMDFERLAHDNAQSYVNLAARYQNWLIASSDETLRAISANQVVREGDWEHSSLYFTDLLKQQNRYSNIGVIGLDGAMVASGEPVAPGLNMRDRPYFINALKSSGFVVGEYQIGRVTGKPTIVVAAALRDARQKPYGVLFASLNLESMMVTVADMHIADGGRFMVLDRHGDLLQASSSPVSPGSRLELSRVVRMSLDGAAERGAGELRAGDGSAWLVSYVRGGPPQDRRALTVVYEQPMQSPPAAASRDFWIAIGVVTLLLGLALGVGWFGTQAIIGRNLRNLTAAAQRLRQRDFKARIGGGVSGQEFVEIAHQFDQMAQELNEHEEATRRVMARQLGQYKILQLITAGRSLPETLAELVLFAQRQIDHSVGSILLLDGDGKTVGQCIAPGLPASYGEALIGAAIGPGVGACGVAMFEKQLVITEDIATDPAWSAFRDIAGDLKVCWSYPIISSSGRVFGSFALYYRTPRPVGEEQLLLSQLAAELAAVAIERSRIEDALTHSEAEYRLLFERNPYPMWVYDDRTLRILAVNDPAIAHYGYSRTQFLLMKVGDLEAVAEAAAEDAGHVRHRRKDGSVILVDIAVFPTSFGGSQAQLALVNDVTEREAMARNISERDQLLSLLMDSTAEAIYGVDLDGRCLFANNACVRLLGFDSAAELLGQPMHDLIHYKHENGSAYPLHECPTQSSLRFGENRHTDGEVLWRKDGTALPIEYWSYPIRRNGKIKGAMVTFLDDTERRRHSEALAYQARHDSLTGLYNRGVLISSIDLAIAEYGQDLARQQQQFSVMIIDLDGFKEVNDALGHQSGDLLLQQVAQRLRGAMPAASILTRLGGDEFAVLAGKLDRGEIAAGGAADIARSVLAKLQQPFQLNGIQIQINASVGIAMYPSDGASTMHLMRNADAAMYQAKREGTGFVFYQQADTDQTPSRLLLMTELRNAFNREQFVLHYQPKTDMRSGGVIGFEALIRWQHPERGLLYPLDFVPIVEISDLIHALTIWVVETAVAQCKRWHDQGNYITIAVNISMRNLLDASMVERVQEILERHELPAFYLELELTESSIMADPARSLDVLTRLHEYGVTVSIDDFGTGYSSLAYLQKLPVDSLKIDRSFVAEMAQSEDARAIVSAIIALAHTVGLKVTAEGIEDEATMQRLATLGCDVAQGYYLSRPLPAQGATAWMQAWESTPD